MFGLLMVAPSVGLFAHLEEPAAVLGHDVFDFGGSIVRKVTLLAERAEFKLPVPFSWVRIELNVLFNLYCHATRTGHEWRDFISAETTQGEEALRVEREAFGGAAA